MVDKRKIVLVGTGFVGMSMAYSLLNQGGINELVLIDVLKDKAEGEAMDLAHGMPCAPNDIVVITAGLSQKPGQTRLDLASANAKIMKEITESVVASGFKGIFLIASNPVDLMTYVVREVSGFDSSKVIGSGTVLDTARLRYLIGKYLKVSSKNVHAYIMGEHGDSSFVPWNHANVGCKKMTEIMKDNKHPMSDLEKIYTEVQQAAYEIINRKKATYYGIGLGLTKIIKAILNDQNEIMTVSTYLKGEYGHEGLYIGVPTIINRKGAREVLELPLEGDEKAKFDKSCETLMSMKGEIDKVIKG